MKKIMLIISILFFVSMGFSQEPILQKKLFGSVTITATGTDSVTIQVPEDFEITQNRIGWKGSLGIQVYALEASGVGTEGTVDVTTKRADWNGKAEDMAAVVKIDDWAWTEGSYKAFAVNDEFPVMATKVYITRNTGDGTIKFFVWGLYIKYE